MKTNKYIHYIGFLAALFFLTSCNDFLDREPLDKVTPEAFFQTDQHLADYTIGRYSFSTKGGYWTGYLSNDSGTDDMVSTSANVNQWVPEKKLTSQSGSISFGEIRSANYFFSKVLPKYEAGTIMGSLVKIKHYIGEMYFIRAWTYYSLLKSYGDFPILTEVLPDDMDVLVQNSKRSPRNEVARFILEDLDKAIDLMTNEKSITANKNRLSKNAALLVKSRVALYEGSWLRYHKGTNRVPNGPNWPGAKLYPNYQFPTGSIEAESDFFLEESVKAAQELIDIPLQGQGEGRINPEPTSTNPFGWNSYYEMFGDVDMGKYDEVILWRAYSHSQNVLHSTSVNLKMGGDQGLTRGIINSFIMDDGLPYYNSNKYKGDKTLDEVMMNRDRRLQLFVIADSDRNDITKPAVLGVSSENTFRERPGLFPDIIRMNQDGAHVTGYALRKGLNYNSIYDVTALNEDTGSLVFRVSEAYLNYIEASYMLYNRLTPEARQVWGQLRNRAGLDVSTIDVTIDNTEMEQEVLNDWGTYSAGKLVDITLYNIRRERRCELMGEGFRWDDIYRWAALNQVRDYIEEGFNLWDENYKRYYSKEGKFLLVEAGTEGAATPNISSRQDSKYLLPFRVLKENNEVYEGYNFRHAKYLSPIPIRHIELASPTGSLEESNFYQNPGWPLTGNSPSLKSNDPQDN